MHIEELVKRLLKGLVVRMRLGRKVVDVEGK
jgi:hypothetical protein